MPRRACILVLFVCLFCSDSVVHIQEDRCDVVLQLEMLVCLKRLLVF